MTSKKTVVRKATVTRTPPKKFSPVSPIGPGRGDGFKRATPLKRRTGTR